MSQAELALRDLDCTDEEIEAIRADAKSVHEGQPDYSQADKWAEIEVRAPADGTVVLSTAVAGTVVSGSTVLFRIAVDSSVASNDASDRAANSPTAID